MKVAILITFALSICFIFIYSLIQLSLIINYLRDKKKVKKTTLELKDEELPIVTIQLPLFNELYVVERLIDCICAFDYPKNKLEIQVLDDSDDESFDIAARKVHFYQLQGIDIQHIKRPERIGYKAGALAFGTAICKGEFIAIFDADFLPEPDFLRKTVPHFADPKIGVVQSKWEYTNADYSFLTKVQAFGLNAHFTIEQVGRNFGDHFINFNGTAGIWRKTCIADAGGWQSDTITEDLDLSYRAQLRGWKFQYLEELGSPSELPVEMNALKAQQYRWTKGAAECVGKNLPKVIRAKGFSLRTKLHATFHLMNSSVFVFILLLSLLSMPVIVIKPELSEYIFLYKLSAFFMLSWFILAAFYWISYSYGKKDKGKLLLSFFVQFPLFLSISMGLALHNSIAVIEGWIGRKTPFVRTPKFNLNSENTNWGENKYNVKKIGLLTYFEAALLIYFIFTFNECINYGDYGMMPMVSFLIIGYSIVFYSSISHWKKSTKTVTYGQTA
ncbi:MAG: glycosyltransferase [Crocinitomix sp.]|nr:glycosyltransferase [Crocinitomix sp.]